MKYATTSSSPIHNSATGVILCAWVVPSLLISTGCQLRSVQTPPEITVVEGEVPAMRYVDGKLKDGLGLDCVGINFSDRPLELISVNGMGNLWLNQERGSYDSFSSIGGMPVPIPKNCQTPIYMRVGWTDSKYYFTTHSMNPKDGGSTDYSEAYIYKSKLVKIEDPIPLDAKTFLVIFLPEGRIKCEILGENPSVEERIKTLSNQKGDL